MPMGAETFQTIRKEFSKLIVFHARLERLWTGGRWTEGPVFLPATRMLLWSDIPNDRMLRWVEGGDVTIYRQPSNNSNGNTLDREGRLITCEHGARRVTRTEIDGSITVLVDNYQGKKLNSPNDVVVKSDGSVWFTDPDYGITSDYEGGRDTSEIGKCLVFRLNPETKELTMVADDFEKPNGLAFSLDESVLYISDTGHREGGPPHIRAFSVASDNTLSGGDVFAVVNPGASDGFRIDERGNMWTSAGDGVHCYSPNGELIGKILVPETVSNVCFGGAKNNRLFITATTSLYSVYLAVRGDVIP